MKTLNNLTNEEKVIFEGTYYLHAGFDDRKLKDWKIAGRPWLYNVCLTPDLGWETAEDLALSWLFKSREQYITYLIITKNENCITIPNFKKKYAKYYLDIVENGLCDSFFDAVQYHEEKFLGDFDSWEEFARYYDENISDPKEEYYMSLDEYDDIDDYIKDLEPNYIEVNGSFYRYN